MKKSRDIDLKRAIETYGEAYSELLGIKLDSLDNDELFKWFLASMLFGAPIAEKAALKTYDRFKDHNVLSPEGILETKWEGLVKILDEGGYTRYDYKTADKLVVVAGSLLNMYGGKLSKIHEAASDPRDLELKLKGLGKGIGDVTVNIFLRDLRGLWKKADPYLTALEILAGERLGILAKGIDCEEALKKLKRFWAVNQIPGKTFLNLESAMVRLGKQYRKEPRHT